MKQAWLVDCVYMLLLQVLMTQLGICMYRLLMNETQCPHPLLCYNYLIFLVNFSLYLHTIIYIFTTFYTVMHCPSTPSKHKA